jgi:hypothetical protein
MTLAGTTWQEIESRLAELPPEDLPEVLEFIDFLAFKREKRQEAQDQIAEQQTPYRVTVKLGGLWADYPISDEEIAATRKEMWAGFGEIDL